MLPGEQQEQKFRKRLLALALLGGGLATAGAIAATATTALAGSVWGKAAAILACALGVAAGIALYLYPRHVVRVLSVQLERAIDRELEAGKRLREVNNVLSANVAAAVREVHLLSDRVVEVQEEERRRIARDLHDGVGQSLAALRMQLDRSREHAEEAPERLRDASRHLQEALDELRQAVYDLRPPELGKTELPEILRSYAERFETRSKISTSFRWQGARVMSEAVATCMLRILQEAFTNVSRHAGAREVGVSVNVGEKMVEMIVADDGKGFDVNSTTAGWGLKGMRERCAFFGGTFTAESSPGGGGARLAARIPLQDKTP